MTFTEAPGNRQDINAARGAMFSEKGVDMNSFKNFNEPENQMRAPPIQPVATPRPEMRGPQNTDIDNILSGLKTRTVDIREEENDSMISINSLKDVQNNNMPKRSRRKPRSDKNTVSLDI
jgi:hypothetical protein